MDVYICPAVYIECVYTYSSTSLCNCNIYTCSPGSVIGPQQQYLATMEQRMWALGKMAANPETLNSKP